jgi:glycosyltransferase involved in cell wall biosynthesis
LRILITTPVFPPDLGGPAVYVPNIAKFLLGRGHQVKVVAFCEDEDPKGHPFKVVAIPRVALPLRYLKSFFAILREARDVDLVYVQEHLALLAVLAARLRGKPCVVRVMVDGSWEIAHRYGWTDDDIDTFQGKSYGFKVWLTRLLQRFWWNRTAAIVPVSDYLRRIVAGHGIDPAKLRLIHNVYNGPKTFEASREECRKKLGIAPGTRAIVTVCRLMIWKGVDGLIRALAKLPADVRLYVVGDGDELGNWTALAKELGVGERVSFVGNRPHAETLEWIRAADVFALNSRYEGLSHTLLEVMFLGTPIVCSNVCGNPELVEHEVNGLLTGFNDVPAIHAALDRMLTDRALASTFAARSQEKVRYFDRETLYGKVEALFEEILARRGAIPTVAERQS